MVVVGEGTAVKLILAEHRALLGGSDACEAVQAVFVALLICPQTVNSGFG